MQILFSIFFKRLTRNPVRPQSHQSYERFFEIYLVLRFSLPVRARLSTTERRRIKRSPRVMTKRFFFLQSRSCLLECFRMKKKSPFLMCIRRAGALEVIDLCLCTQLHRLQQTTTFKVLGTKTKPPTAARKPNTPNSNSSSSSSSSPKLARSGICISMGDFKFIFFYFLSITPPPLSLTKIDNACVVVLD